jgi:hypothetical protein
MFCLKCDRKYPRHNCRLHGLYIGDTCVKCDQAASPQLFNGETITNPRKINAETLPATGRPTGPLSVFPAGTEVWCSKQGRRATVIIDGIVQCCSLCYSPDASTHQAMTDLAGECDHTGECSAHPGAGAGHHFTVLQVSGWAGDVRRLPMGGVAVIKLENSTVRVGHRVLLGGNDLTEYLVTSVSGDCPEGFARCFQLEWANAGVTVFLPINQLVAIHAGSK